jgi:hypothetical protein
MRTIRVELHIPVEGTGDMNVCVSTEVIVADDDPETARDAGEQARAAIDAFLVGYGGS